jgi:acetyl esterase/lipase
MMKFERFGRAAAMCIGVWAASGCQVADPCDQLNADQQTCSGKSLQFYSDAGVADRVPTMTELRQASTTPPSNVCTSLDCATGGLPYGTDPKHKLEIFYPRPGDPAPDGVVFYVHGGAWNAFDDRVDLDPFLDPAGNCTTGWDIECDRPVHEAARRLTRRGFILVSIDYREAGWQNGQPTNSFPTPLTDVKRAIRWVKWHLVNQVGLSASQISPFVGIGHSAGANLVSLAAASAGQHEPADAPTQFDSKLDGVVNIGGVLDMRVWLTGNYARLRQVPPPLLPQFELLNEISEYLGCSVAGSDYAVNGATFPACCTGGGTVNGLSPCHQPSSGALQFSPKVDAASVHAGGAPTSYLDALDPPFYVALSTRDGLVQPSTSCHAAVWYDQHFFPGESVPRTHDFWVDLVEEGFPNGDAGPGAQNGAAFGNWLQGHAVKGLNLNVLETFFAALRDTPGHFPPPNPALTQDDKASAICADYQ